MSGTDRSQPSTSPPASEITSTAFTSLTGTSRTRHSRNTSEADEKSKKQRLPLPLPPLPPLPVESDVLSGTLKSWYDGTIGLTTQNTTHEDREAMEAQFRMGFKWAFPNTSDDAMQVHLSVIYSFQASLREERVYAYFKAMAEIATEPDSPVLKPTALNIHADAGADDVSDSSQTQHASPVLPVDVQLAGFKLMQEKIDAMNSSIETIPRNVKSVFIGDFKDLTADFGVLHLDVITIVQSLTNELRRVNEVLSNLKDKVDRLTENLNDSQAKAEAATKDAAAARSAYKDTLTAIEELKKGRESDNAKMEAVEASMASLTADIEARLEASRMEAAAVQAAADAAAAVKQKAAVEAERVLTQAH